MAVSPGSAEAFTFTGLSQLLTPGSGSPKAS
jgi:hypothetical protein